ncbi:TatD DNase family Scn1 [Irpex rosettiformis]|uniref:TatD DNase family Scn1 n=1 Tax=Irpex rosettiformis TaxID=378272 RepID=A0ACB8UL79_9APHY|nr:TatD DNase family Scn1 [Irpex rosettiformis]
MCQPSSNAASNSSSSSSDALPPVCILAHLVDVHCHPTDSSFSSSVMDNLPLKHICAMATRATDQSLVKELAFAYPEKVVPCFGHHPWFTHWIAVKPFNSKEEHYRSLFFGTNSSPKQETLDAFQRLLSFLPDPTPLDDALTSVRLNLAAFPNAMVGEVGLDRVCRIPYSYPAFTPYASSSNGEGKRELSPFTIPLDHQLVILEVQLDLAVELKRNVSLHSVKSQEATVKLLKKMQEKHGSRWTEISVDLHSCTLSAPTLKDIQKAHPNIFLSLSTAINTRSPAYRSLVTTCPDTRILVESDYHDVSYSTPQCWDMVLRIAEVKGWRVEQEEWVDGDGVSEAEWGVVRRLERNWRVFRDGGHVNREEKRKKRKGE